MILYMYRQKIKRKDVKFVHKQITSVLYVYIVVMIIRQMINHRI